jgi:ADP-ribosylglycohydrolase
VNDQRAGRERYAARVRGCLLGGVIGDGLGAPVEFWSLNQIRAAVGDEGVRSYLPHGAGSDVRYAALVHQGPSEVRDALALAVTHSGDSDSTGALCGNLLGALHGDTALPPGLAFEVEGRGTILQLADDLVWEFTQPDQLDGELGPQTRWTERY